MKKNIFKIGNLLILFILSIQLLQAAQVPDKTILYASCDINGDGKKENVYVKVLKNDEHYTEVSYLVIKDAANKKKLAQFDLGAFNLSDNQLMIGDLTGNGINELAVKLYTGGSDGRTDIHIFQYANGKFKQLNMNIDEMGYSKSTIECINGKYFMTVSVPRLNKQCAVDISNTDIVKKYEDLNEADILGALNGGENQGPDYTLEDFDGDGKPEVVSITYVNGMFHSDNIGILRSYYKYNSSIKEWQCIGAKVKVGDEENYVATK